MFKEWSRFKKPLILPTSEILLAYKVLVHVDTSFMTCNYVACFDLDIVYYLLKENYTFL